MMIVVVGGDGGERTRPQAAGQVVAGGLACEACRVVLPSRL